MTEPLGDDGCHGCDVVGSGRIVGGAAIAHDVSAHSAMWHLGADVDGVPSGVERVEVFRKRLPLPLDAFGHGRARNVFDAFHHVDEPVVAIARSRRESDTAVSHDRRGHAVP